MYSEKKYVTDVLMYLKLSKSVEDLCDKNVSK